MFSQKNDILRYIEFACGNNDLQIIHNFKKPKKNLLVVAHYDQEMTQPCLMAFHGRLGRLSLVDNGRPWPFFLGHHLDSFNARLSLLFLIFAIFAFSWISTIQHCVVFIFSSRDKSNLSPFSDLLALVYFWRQTDCLFCLCFNFLLKSNSQAYF